MHGVKILEAKISADLYAEITERIRLGLYSTESQVIDRALRKAFAEETREFLRKLIRNMGITQKKLMVEWKKVRR